MSEYFKEQIAAQSGVQILDDIHGVAVYNGGIPTRFAFIDASFTLGHSVSRFLELFEEGYTADYHLTEKQEVAFELYSAFTSRPPLVHDS